jgi:DNA-binding beta-propeller fold protein YncE
VLGLDQPAPIPLDRLYGPRGLAFDGARRRVIVTDTGHKRLVVFDAEGRGFLEAGAGGSGPGDFDEPVGIAVDPRDGSVTVADAWNGRIQRLGPGLDFQGSWPVPGWGGKDPADKPYVAVDDRGTVYASVPAKSRVLVFDPDGTPLLSLVGSDWKGAARPAGVAADPAAGALLVADAARDRVVALPLMRSAEDSCR